MTSQQIINEHRKRRKTFLGHILRGGVVYPAVMAIGSIFLMQQALGSSSLSEGGDIDLSLLQMSLIPSVFLFGLILVEFILAFKNYRCPKCETVFLSRAYNVVVNNPKRCPECDVALR